MKMPPTITSGPDVYLSQRGGKSQPHSGDRGNNVDKRGELFQTQHISDDWGQRDHSSRPMPSSMPSSSSTIEHNDNDNDNDIYDDDEDDVMKDGLVLALENLLPRKKNGTTTPSIGLSLGGNSTISSPNSDRSSRASTINSQAFSASSKGAAGQQQQQQQQPGVSPRAGGGGTPRRSKRRDDNVAPSTIPFRSPFHTNYTRRSSGASSDTKTAATMTTAVTSATSMAGSSCILPTEPSSPSTLTTTDSPVEPGTTDDVILPTHKSAPHPRHRSRSSGGKVSSSSSHRRKKSPRGHNAGGTQPASGDDIAAIGAGAVEIPGEDGDDENETDDGFRLVVPTTAGHYVTTTSSRRRSMSPSKQRRRRSPRQGGGRRRGGDTSTTRAIDYADCDEDGFPLSPQLSVPSISSNRKPRSRSPRSSHTPNNHQGMILSPTRSTDGWMRQMSEDRFAGTPTNPFKKVLSVDSIPCCPKSPVPTTKESSSSSPRNTTTKAPAIVISPNPRKGRRQRRSESSQVTDTIDPFTTPFNPVVDDEPKKNSMSSLIDLVALMSNSELPIDSDSPPTSTTHEDGSGGVEPSTPPSSPMRRSKTTTTTTNSISPSRVRSRSQDGQKWLSPVAAQQERLSSSSAAMAMKERLSSNSTGNIIIDLPVGTSGGNRDINTKNGSKHSKTRKSTTSKSPAPSRKGMGIRAGSGGGGDATPQAPCSSPRLRDSSNHSTPNVTNHRSTSVASRQNKSEELASSLVDIVGCHSAHGRRHHRLSNNSANNLLFEDTTSSPTARRANSVTRRPHRFRRSGSLAPESHAGYNDNVVDFDPTQSGPEQQQKNQAWLRRRLRAQGDGTSQENDISDLMMETPQQRRQALVTEQRRRSVGKGCTPTATGSGGSGSNSAASNPPTRRMSRSVERPSTRRVSGHDEQQQQQQRALTRKMSKSVDRGRPSRKMSRSVERPMMKPSTTKST